MYFSTQKIIYKKIRHKFTNCTQELNDRFTHHISTTDFDSFEYCIQSNYYCPIIISEAKENLLYCLHISGTKFEKYRLKSLLGEENPEAATG